MALQELPLTSTAIDIAMTLTSSLEPVVMIAVLHQLGLSLYEWPVKTMSQKLPELVHDFSLQNEVDSLLWPSDLQISFASEDVLIVLRHDRRMTHELLISTRDPYSIKLYPNKSKNVENIVNPGPVQSANKALLLPDQDMETDVLKLDQEINAQNLGFNAGPNHAPFTIGLFSIPNSSVEAIKYDKESPPDSCDAASDHIVFSLAENGSLFADRRSLARQCTSFLVTPAHLIFTTSQNLLKFVHLANAVSGKRGVALTGRQY